MDFLRIFNQLFLLSINILSISSSEISSSIYYCNTFIGTRLKNFISFLTLLSSISQSNNLIDLDIISYNIKVDVD